MHQQMSVVNYKSTEEKCSGSSKHQLYRLTVEKQLEANEREKKCKFNFLLNIKISAQRDAVT